MRIRTLAVAALFALGCSFAHAQTLKLKWGIFLPPTDIAAMMWKKWADQVNRDAAGAIEIEMYFGGALGRDPRAQLEMLENGVTDIAWILPFFTPGRFPDVSVTNLPLIITGAKEGSRAAWALYEKGLMRGHENMVVLCLSVSPPTVLFATKPLPDLASLAGRKSSASTDMQHKILRALGAAPVSGFNFSTSAEALQRGSLEVDLMNFTASVTFKQFDVARHAMILPIGPSAHLVAMLKSTYDKLPPGGKAAIDKNRGLPLVTLWADTIGAREEEVRAKWRSEAGRSYTELSAADMAKAEALLAPVVKEWESANPNGAVLVRTLREEVARARALR